jgi:hypothetical protein
VRRCVTFTSYNIKGAIFDRRHLAYASRAALAAAVFGVLATPPPTSSIASKCPPGEEENYATGICVPSLPTSIVEITNGPYGGLPQIDGVLCTGHNSYECLGLAEESQAAGPTPTPPSTLEADPSKASATPSSAAPSTD